MAGLKTVELAGWAAPKVKAMKEIGSFQKTGLWRAESLYFKNVIQRSLDNRSGLIGGG